MPYSADMKSIKQHEPPKWYMNAKFGIFIHWGLYSVPAFAPVKYGDITQTIGVHGYEFHFAHNPYAEWYQNSLRIGAADYRNYHNSTFGKDFMYEDFALMFNEGLKDWDPEEWASLFQKAGAKYVIITTKHHDGFLLWPSKFKNPNIENYYASKNIVKNLTEKVRENGMKMGIYYSGALDWSFNHKPIKETTSMLANWKDTKRYGEYVDNHFKELIDNFKPDVLWNDIGYPAEGDPLSVVAYYHNTVPEGVVNDRWGQIPKISKYLEKTFLIKRIINKIGMRVVKKSGFDAGKPKGVADYSTPEYSPNTQLRPYKWECCRGIGRSFGYNKMETIEHYLSNEELIHSFIDIVSKNGNLLLNVGPKADGKIPEIQVERLEAMGKWLKINGEGIYDTTPWKIAETVTDDGLKVRFTQKDNDIFAFVLDIPTKDTIKIILKDITDLQDLQSLKRICIMGIDGDINFKTEEDGILIDLPEIKKLKYAIGLKMMFGTIS